MRDVDANNAAYSAILSKISEGELKPGTWLREGTLAAELGTSRTPVREALRSLAAENLVEIVRNRGARVRNWSEEEVYEIYGLRALIEGYGARLASQRATAQQISELVRIHASMEQAVADRGDAFLDVVAEINAEFHGKVTSIAASPMLEVLIANLSSVPVVKRAFRGYDEEDLMRSVIQHKDILRAIQEKDGDLAQAAMAGHILAARYAASKVLHSGQALDNRKTGS